MKTFVILSASLGTLTHVENVLRTDALRAKIHSLGFDALRVLGCYVSPNTGETEHEVSFLVPTEPCGVPSLLLLAKGFDQESALIDVDGVGSLRFTDGKSLPLGHRRPGKSPDGFTSTPLGDFHYA